MMVFDSLMVGHFATVRHQRIAVWLDTDTLSAPVCLTVTLIAAGVLGPCWKLGVTLLWTRT